MPGPGSQPCPKPLPRKVQKFLNRKVETREDGKDRDVIRALYKRRCGVCGRKTTTVHEHKRRGAGGVVSIENSFLACDIAEGGVCHPLLQDRFITPLVGSDPLEIGADVRRITGFRMARETFKAAFGNRAQPNHIEIQD